MSLWQDKPPPLNKIDRLTSVRGFAALYVVLFHCQGLVAGFNLTPWTNLVEKGYLAVDFFFVLSGFIIAYVYAAEFDAGSGDYRRFLWLRLARVYPVHLVMLAVVFGLWGFGDSLLFTNTPRTLASNALLVHSWGISRKLSFNFPSWSVSAEWFAYLAFPLLLSLSKPVARRPALAVACAIASIVVLGICASQLLPPGIVIGGRTLELNAMPARPFDMASTFALLRVTLEFLAGLFLFRAFGELGRAGRVGWVTIVTAGLLLLTLHSTRLPPIVQDTLAVSEAAILILCLALGGGAGGLLDSRAALFLGEASYSIYMVHGLVVLAYMQLIEQHAVPAEASLAAGLLTAAAGVAIVITLGILMHRCVEVPARSVLRSWSDRLLSSESKSAKAH
jgi:peptidoglycan/LPS O-acetylase OafA/YrhL